MRINLGDIYKLSSSDMIEWTSLIPHDDKNAILIRARDQETMCRHFAELGINGRELLQDLKAVVGMNADTEFERIYKNTMKAAI